MRLCEVIRVSRLLSWNRLNGIKNFIQDLENSVCVIYQATMYMDGSYDFIHIGEQESDYDPDSMGTPIASYAVV